MAAPRPLTRLRRALHGPYPTLASPLDAASERWSALPPRVRILVTAVALTVLAGAVGARVQAAEHRWGGPPVQVLVATEHLPVGAGATAVRRVALPPAVVPADAVTQAPPKEAVLALALPEGAVLTAAHLDPRGPAAGLEAHLRAVPVAVEEGWVVTAGGWVDVWVLAAGGEPATLVARSRPVLEVRTEGASTTALVGLDGQDEVGAATEGLALGRLLLAHAPAPPATPPRSGSPSPSD